MAHTILVVEDDETIIESVSLCLQPEGWYIVPVTTGSQALKMLQQKEISLIILDIGLPDINGFDLCTEIRRTNTVPIIFLTARTEEINSVIGLEIGGDRFLVKPFKPQKLVLAVRTLLRREYGYKQKTRDENYPGAELFKIDEENKQIIYCKCILKLTLAEFIILCALLTRKNRTFTREDLIELLPEDHELILSRTIDSMVKRLRRKLKAVKPDYDPIESLYGLGYRFRPLLFSIIHDGPSDYPFLSALELFYLL